MSLNHSPLSLCCHGSIQTGRRSGVLWLISPLPRTAPLLRWRSTWSMASSSLRTWTGCWPCDMTSSGARSVTVAVIHHMMWRPSQEEPKPIVSPPQVVFDESLQKCLDSYLRHSPRGLDPSSLPSSPAVADMQRCIHRAVFMTFLRMATHKESKVPLLSRYSGGLSVSDNSMM